MPDGYLTIEHGHVSLGGKLVPGLFVTMEIAGQVRFDKAEADNLSGKKKTPMGWEDSLLTIELDLLSDGQTTCYEKLAQVNAIFKGMDNNSNPKVYDIVNAHVVARGVDQVVFKGLRSRETDEDDIIRAVLDFDEHNPPTIPPEIQRSAAADSDQAPEVNQDADVVADAAVTADPDSPFEQGLQDGLS